MQRWTRWATMVAVVATTVALGLSSASATAPTPTPAPQVPAGAPNPNGVGNVPAAAPARPAKSETLFYPLAPCRIADTRSGGGALANLGTRTFHVRGKDQFTQQGGTNGGCGVPDSATAVTANVTVTGAAGGGYLTGYPAGSSEPKTNFVSYNGGQNITANPTLTLSAFGSTPQLSIRNHGPAAQVIIDVTGYYAPQIQALVSAGGAVFAGSTRVLSSVKTGNGSFEVTVDTDVSYCTPDVVPYTGSGLYADAYTLDGNTVSVSLWTLNGTATPVPLDAAYFYLTVTC